MKPLFVRLLFPALAVLLLVSCAAPAGQPSAPITEFAAGSGPRAPIREPNLLGKPGSGIVAISTAEEAADCFATGQAVYGLALQNANVRSAATVNACRLGKINKGSLVELTQYVNGSGNAVTAAEPALASPLTVTAGLSATAEISTTAAVATLILTPVTGTAGAAATPVVEPSGELVVAPVGPTIGYVEDIQPLFESRCAACHNVAARLKGLQVTAYGPLMTGSISGTVVIPGDVENSKLWQLVSTGVMPQTGKLPDDEIALITAWIAQGAAERRAPPPVAVVNAAAPAVAEPADAGTADASDEPQSWYMVADAAELAAVTADGCEAETPEMQRLVSTELILPVACGAPPEAAAVNALRATYDLPGATAVAAVGGSAKPAAAAQAGGDASSAPPDVETQAAAPARVAVAAGGTAIQSAPLGLPPASDSDPYFIPQGGFCFERRLPDNERGITALTFAPDGTLYLALDSDLTGEVDPLILYDAFHPSRSVAVYNSNGDGTNYTEILQESTRITGLDWQDGVLYLSRAGEVGRLPDGGGYEPLAGGFAVNSQLFHANNGLVISNGWLYVSAGGVIDGYYEGPITGIGEDGAQAIAGGGNPYAARIVRAPLDALNSARSISVFSTAARGVRNPYGITVDPAGRIWWTDNGATNVPDEISAGDEVDVLDPAAIGGDESSAPYYGFPLALVPPIPDWYTPPVFDMVNSAAPTGIAWAHGTIFYAQYGRNPGIFRLARAADGSIISERILMAWPVLALATAPDGALWVGMGDGGLYRVTPGCGG
jgi:glucose/arabinose dehydrogenase